MIEFMHFTYLLNNEIGGIDFMISKIRKIINNPYSIFSPLFYRGHLKWIPDKQALQLWYRSIFGKKLNLKDPKTFNEKLQWLKLYDRNNIYPTIVDKYTAKKYVSDIIGDEYLIKTLGVYDCFEEIDIEKLPNSFVIKCTHDSGGIVICTDKNKLDFTQAKNKIEKSLACNYYYEGREWPYKVIKPRVIVEEYMSNDDGKQLMDYKFFCFNGHVKCLYVSEGSHTKNQKLQFFDVTYSPMDCKRKDYLEYNKLPQKPLNFDLMINLAEKLSYGIPHVRVDLYEINNKVYFGEMTLYTCSGFIPFVDEKWDRIFGDYLDLPNIKL